MFRKLLVLIFLAGIAPVSVVRPVNGATERTTSCKPKLDRPSHVAYALEGVAAAYLQAVTENWLLVAPDNNPAMLGMFRDRDTQPRQDLLPWSGEFAGKYLTAAVQILRLTRDARLERRLRRFVAELIALQAEDGYLGPWPKPCQLTGKAPNDQPKQTWDAWNHYHVMLGLLLWHEHTGDEKALAAAQKIGDLLCDRFLGKPGSLAGIGSCEMNLAPAHGLSVLYRTTGRERYRQLAEQIIESDFPTSGKWRQTALAGNEFYEGPLPRWESLHPIMALAEMYYVTGRDDYRDAFEQIWWSIVKLDRHNTGGFSSGERAVGNPYESKPIETCCTIAWTALSVEMLRLTGNSIVADEMELTYFNAILGSLSPDGSWSTYNTPMDGRRVPNTQDIAFQKRPGSEQLNCCSVNAPRGLGMLSDWAVMKSDSGLALNWYGPARLTAEIDGAEVTLTQTTDYPKSGAVTIEIGTSQEMTFDLGLRIPCWSKKTQVQVGDATFKNVAPGRYFTVHRKWKSGDVVRLDLDMSLHFWAGQRECDGRCCVYRGPILLAYTPRFPEIIYHKDWPRFGPLHCSRELGAAFSAEFDGRSIHWIGKRFDDAGLAQVVIDGRKVATVDQYGPERGLPFRWQHAGLEPGPHKITVTIAGKSEESEDCWINVERLETESPAFDALTMQAQLAGAPSSLLAIHTQDTTGRQQILRDFDSAGANGRPYVTWLNVANVPTTAFEQTNPLPTSPVQPKP